MHIPRWSTTAHDLFGTLHPLRLSGTFSPVRWVAVANLVGLVIVAALLLFDLQGPAQPVLVLNGTARFFPLVIFVVVVAGGIAMTALGVAVSRASFLERMVLSVAVVAVALVTLTQLLPEVSNRGFWVTAGLASVVVGLLEMQRWQRRWLPVQILALFAPYVITLIGIGLRGSTDPIFPVRAIALTPLAAIGAGVLAIASVAEDLESRHAVASRWTGRPRSQLVVTVVLLLKLALIAVLYAKVGRDFLGGLKVWSLRNDAPLSWAHALLVAVAIYALATVTEKRPLYDTGRRSSTAAILVTSTINSAGAPFVMAFPSLALPVMWVADHVTLLQIIAIAAIAVAACLQILRQRRLTAGTALLLLAALWLLPPLAGILVARPDNHIPTFWATPIQVDVVLTSIIALRLLMPRRWRTSTRVQLRVILIPAVLIYSEIFFPEAWDHQLAKCFLVVAVVWLLTARAPLVSADPRRQTRVLCMLLGTQLAILVVYYLAFTSPNFQRYMSASVFVGWLWFAVPFAGNLTARITGSETHSYSGASGLRRHRHGESNRRAEG
jgi:hypothetical protein